MQLFFQIWILFQEIQKLVNQFLLQIIFKVI